MTYAFHSEISTVYVLFAKRHHSVQNTRCKYQATSKDARQSWLQDYWWNRRSVIERKKRFISLHFYPFQQFFSSNFLELKNNFKKGIELEFKETNQN